MKMKKVTGLDSGETKEIRVKVKKVPRTTQNTTFTVIKEEPREITITSHVEEVKDPVVPKTVRVRTISEPKKTVTVRVVEVKEDSDSPRAGRKGKTK